MQHVAWGGPGELLTQGAAKNKATLDVVAVWRDWLPPFAAYDGIVVLGGPANVDQEKKYPFLVEEKRYLKRAVDADKPVLAFCLGHQLLASTLGAAVGPNFKPSIGFIQGHLTHDGREHPAFRNLPPKVPFFKWHSQAVLEPLPKSISLLATSAHCQVEAISLKGRPHILGIQCDNHAALPEDVTRWLAALPSPGVNPGELIRETVRMENQVREDFDRFFSDYLALLR